METSFSSVSLSGAALDTDHLNQFICGGKKRDRNTTEILIYLSFRRILMVMISFEIPAFLSLDSPTLQLEGTCDSSFFISFSISSSYFTSLYSFSSKHPLLFNRVLYFSLLFFFIFWVAFLSLPPSAQSVMSRDGNRSWR